MIIVLGIRQCKKGEEVTKSPNENKDDNVE